MSTLAEIEAATDTLPSEQAEQLIQHLVARLERKQPPGPRIAGLHAGAWEVGPEFDEPLPDEFWLGKDV